MRPVLDVDKRVYAPPKRNSGGGWNKGISPSPEVRAQISAKLKGKKLSFEHAAKNREQCLHMGISLRGTKHTLERRAQSSMVRKGRTPWNLGVTHSSEAKAKMSAKQKIAQRKRHPVGTRKMDTMPTRNRYVIPEVVEWREAVYARDHFTCQHCLRVGGILNAHHIKPWAKFPALRFEIDNGITLCVPCHKAEHKRMRKEANQ